MLCEPGNKVTVDGANITVCGTLAGVTPVPLLCNYPDVKNFCLEYSHFFIISFEQQKEKGKSYFKKTKQLQKKSYSKIRVKLCSL